MNNGEKIITSDDIPGKKKPEAFGQELQSDDDRVNIIKRTEFDTPFKFDQEVYMVNKSEDGRSEHYEPGWKVSAIKYEGQNAQIEVRSTKGEVRTISSSDLAGIQTRAFGRNDADIISEAADRARGVVGEAEKSPEERQELVQEAAEDLGEEAVEHAGVEEPIPSEVPKKSP